MSELEKPVAPVGEEIHLPGGSLHPLLLTVGITMSLIGVTISPIALTLPGLIITVVVLYKWIQESRQEMASLPASHD